MERDNRRSYSFRAMNTLGDRVREARVGAGLSQEALAKKIGIKQPSVAAIESNKPGKKARGTKHLVAIAEVTGRRALWLATGKGEPLDQKHKKSLENYKLPSLADMETVAVPEYNVRVSAGGGFHIGDETIKDSWVFSRSYIENELHLPAAANGMVILEVMGDSMEPTLHSGDRVLVNMGDRRISQPGIFVLWDGDGTVVKRLEIVPDSDPPKLMRISDNPRHKTYEVLAEHANIIGRVVWVARRM